MLVSGSVIPWTMCRKSRPGRGEEARLPRFVAVFQVASIRVKGLGFRVEGLGLRVEGLGLRVEGLGLRV